MLTFFKRSVPPPSPLSPSISEKSDLAINEDPEALDVVADMLYRTCWPLGWVPIQQVESAEWTNEVILGVSIRAEDGTMRSSPMAHGGMAEFEQGAAGLNARVAMKMRCRAVEYTMKNHIDPDADMFELYIDANTRIQVLDTMDQLPTARGLGGVLGCMSLLWKVRVRG